MTEISMEIPVGAPTHLICNASARKRIVNELYSRFGGARFQCRCQLDINSSGLYAAPIIVNLPGDRHPRRLACPGCAPAAPTPPQVRKTILKGGTLLPYIQGLFQQQNGQCAYCEGTVRIVSGSNYLPDRATIDHVMPRSRGGSKAFENLILACFDCNNLKGDMTPLEILRALCITACRLNALRVLPFIVDTGIRPESNRRSEGPGEVQDGTVSTHLGNPGLGTVAA